MAVVVQFLEHFNFEMLRWLREQTPTVEAEALFICAVNRRSERVLNFENIYSQSQSALEKICFESDECKADTQPRGAFGGYIHAALQPSVWSICCRAL